MADRMVVAIILDRIILFLATPKDTIFFSVKFLFSSLVIMSTIIITRNMGTFITDHTPLKFTGEIIKTC
jgi:hypothetical protein